MRIYKAAAIAVSQRKGGKVKQSENTKSKSQSKEQSNSLLLLRATEKLNSQRESASVVVIQKYMSNQRALRSRGYKPKGGKMELKAEAGGACAIGATLNFVTFLQKL